MATDTSTSANGTDTETAPEAVKKSVTFVSHQALMASLSDTKIAPAYRTAFLKGESRAQGGHPFDPKRGDVTHYNVSACLYNTAEKSGDDAARDNIHETPIKFARKTLQHVSCYYGDTPDGVTVTIRVESPAYPAGAGKAVEAAMRAWNYTFKPLSGTGKYLVTGGGPRSAK